MINYANFPAESSDMGRNAHVPSRRSKDILVLAELSGRQAAGRETSLRMQASYKGLPLVCHAGLKHVP